jgi:type II secretory pathway pseudopilin PulG
MRMADKHFLKTSMTIAELVLVVVILGILSTTALSMFSTARLRAREKQVVHNLRALLTVVEAYGYQNENLPVEAQYNCDELCARYGAPEAAFKTSGRERYVFLRGGEDYDDYLALSNEIVIFEYYDRGGKQRFSITRNGTINEH